MTFQCISSRTYICLHFLTLENKLDGIKSIKTKEYLKRHCHKIEFIMLCRNGLPTGENSPTIYELLKEFRVVRVSKDSSLKQSIKSEPPTSFKPTPKKFQSDRPLWNKRGREDTSLLTEVYHISVAQRCLCSKLEGSSNDVAMSRQSETWISITKTREFRRLW